MSTDPESYRFPAPDSPKIKPDPHYNSFTWAKLVKRFRNLFSPTYFIAVEMDAENYHVNISGDISASNSKGVVKFYKDLEYPLKRSPKGITVDLADDVVLGLSTPSIIHHLADTYRSKKIEIYASKQMSERLNSAFDISRLTLSGSPTLSNIKIYDHHYVSNKNLEGKLAV